jgi:uracil-DNA glycosylase family protein
VTDRACSAAEYIPPHPTLDKLVHAVQRCHGCDLYRYATQAVFGEGPESARVVLVGEQPGDQEDRQGRPFVGPAGKLLDRALADAGLDRSKIYVTNAVKHFKFEERGKRRIHKKPAISEVNACKPWLEAEIQLLKPKAIVCLGAIATLAVLGKDYRLTKERGKIVQHAWATVVTATVHPSAILRAPDSTQREIEYEHFVSDLKIVRREILKKK